MPCGKTPSDEMPCGELQCGGTPSVMMASGGIPGVKNLRCVSTSHWSPRGEMLCANYDTQPGAAHTRPGQAGRNAHHSVEPVTDPAGPATRGVTIRLSTTRRVTTRRLFSQRGLLGGHSLCSHQTPCHVANSHVARCSCVGPCGGTPWGQMTCGEMPMTFHAAPTGTAQARPGHAEGVVEGHKARTKGHHTQRQSRNPVVKMTRNDQK